MRSDTYQKVILPLLGAVGVLVVWAVVSATLAPDLPSPLRTWQESRRYILDPFFKDGEMNQGMGRLAFYSLVRVGKGFALALAIGTPIGFLLRSEEHTSELQSRFDLVCRLLLEKKKMTNIFLLC